MSLRIAESKNADGSVEYFFVGLDYFEDFDVISATLKDSFGAVLTESLDGIYSRTNTFERSGLKFKLIFHEDVGNYATCVDQQEKYNAELKQILEESLSEIEMKIHE